MFLRPTLFLVLTLVAFLVPGCTDRSATPQAVGTRAAVIDLDVVAKAMGWDATIQRKVDEATRSLNAQLLQAAREMEQEISGLQSKFGAHPTEEQAAKLREARLRQQQQIRSNKLVAEQARQSVRAEQVNFYRAQVAPVAAKIAKGRGAEVLLVADADVLWFSSSIDVTGETVSSLRARPDPVTDHSTNVNSAPKTESSAETNKPAEPAHVPAK